MLVCHVDQLLRRSYGVSTFEILALCSPDDFEEDQIQVLMMFSIRDSVNQVEPGPPTVLP
jgi:cyanate lyase